VRAWSYLCQVTLAKLPGWVIDADASVREDVADWVDASDAERWDATRRCAQAAARMLRFHDDPMRALDWTDPLPASTVAALARLRSTSQR
jgi:hypothetical protein